ncbi:MAG: FkbM family methyltransferase [Acidimicrobiaceae bacterium]|nr:FkbM family methyltransferase [Acidimicrobiaceae bacterium]
MTREILLSGRRFKINGDPKDTYFTGLGDGHEFIDDGLEVLRATVVPDSVIVDVGANIGLHALSLAATCPRGHVHAFEPVPRTERLLRENIDLNGAPNITVYPVAAGAERGVLRFFDNEEFAAGSMALDGADPLLVESLAARSHADTAPTGTREAQGREIAVPCARLDDYYTKIGLTRLDVLKIDAEGHDLQVLRGAREVLARFRPLVQLEFASYALSMHQRILPSDALAEVREIFDRIFVVTRGGGLSEIVSNQDAVDFLYDNAVNRPVQDLVGVFHDSRLLDGVLAVAASEVPIPPTTEHVDRLSREVAELRAQLEGIQNSKSWRATKPLRLVRRFVSDRWRH